MEYIKPQRNILTIPENDENLPPNTQNDSKSIDSTKLVTLADSKSKLAGSKIKVAHSKLKDSKMKQIDNASSKEAIEEKVECEDETKLSCLTELEATVVLAEKLSEDLSWQDSDSDFGEVECGEPTVTRKLTVDFTMSQDDTEFVQQKCCDFWNFIHSNPYLQHMTVIPEPDEEDKTQQEEVLQESVSSASSSTPQSTAIEILQKNDEIVPQAFAAKQPVICHNQDYRAYCHGSCARLDKEMMRTRRQEEAAKERSKKQLTTIDTQPHRRSSPSFLTSLCSELDAWDLQHPKSFDPPALVPSSCSPESSAEPRSASMSPSDLVCTSDMMCVPCAPSTEGRLKLDKVDLELRAEE